MAKKTISIINLLTSVQNYAVGGVPEGLQDRVSSIKFHGSTNNYNKGYQIEGPVYVIEFEESSVKRLVPLTAVIDVGILIEEANANQKHITDITAAEAIDEVTA